MEINLFKYGVNFIDLLEIKDRRSQIFYGRCNVT